MTAHWPLTPLEEYLFHQDRPAYPWDFFVRLDLAGDLDRETADTALRRCIDRHPLLRSVVVSDSCGRLAWHPSQMTSTVRWTTNGPAGVYPTATHIDIRRESGLRVRAVATQDGTECFFQFHHACCDALGALSFLEDWLREYGQLAGQLEGGVGPTVYDSERLQQRLQHRDTLQRQPKSILRTMREHGARLSRTCKFLVRAPVPLVDYARVPNDGSPSEEYPAVRSFRFDEAATDRIKSVARRQGVTVNDLLCRDLFVAMDQYQHSIRSFSDHAWLRLMIPVDLRREAPEGLSAANVLSLVFLSRRRKACRDLKELLQGIHQEMQQIKRGGLSRAFLTSLQIRKRLPGGLRQLAQSTRCATTAVLTNVGPTFARSPLLGKDGRLLVGRLQLRGVDFVSPIGPQTCANFSACTYAGRLTMNLHYDPRAMASCDADRLLNMLTDRLSETG